MNLLKRILSVETYATYINITGWETIYSKGGYIITANDEFCNLQVYLNSTWCDSTLRPATDENILPDEYKPRSPVSATDFAGNVRAVVRDNESHVSIQSLTGGVYTGAWYLEMLWKRRK